MCDLAIFIHTKELTNEVSTTPAQVRWSLPKSYLNVLLVTSANR